MAEEKKVLWKIKLKDGTTREFTTKEKDIPAVGDGFHVNGLPVEIKEVLTTPTIGAGGGHDMAIAATEC